MSEPAEQFALVPLPPPGAERDAMTANAIMVGDMSAVTEPILSSKAREATEALLNAAADAVEHEQRLARQRKRQEAEARADAIQRLCSGIAKMAQRLDAHEQTRRAAAREARHQARADIEASLPDPDEPGTRAEIPNVNPGFAPKHEPGETSFEYTEDTATGVLPPGAELPSETGELAVWDPEELAEPQKPIPQTPTAIGGP
jgi:hypothetical protein